MEIWCGTSRSYLIGTHPVTPPRAATHNRPTPTPNAETAPIPVIITFIDKPSPPQTACIC